MTQIQRPPVKWLVPLPADDPYGKQSFKAACKGKSDLGDMLNYFLYAASWKVEHSQNKSDTSPFITIERTLDHIAGYLNISKKTAIARIHKLEAWKFITPHGYQHTYDVHYKEVTKAILAPPEPEKPRLRGIHAKRIVNLQSSPEHDGKDARIQVLEQQIVNLQSAIVRMLNLQSEMLNLQSLQSPEHTPEATLGGEIAPLKSSDSDEDKRDSSPSPSEQHTEPFLVPTLPLRDDECVSQSSYSHEPAAPSPDKSEWLWESEGEEDIFSEDDPDETVKRPVVQGGNLAPGEGRAPLESEDRREGSNEHPAVKPTGSRQPPASPGQAARMREQPTGQYNPHEKPRQPTRTPEPEAVSLPLPDKTVEKGNRKKDAPLLCETKKVRELIDATRGHALEDPGALINQSKIIHAWCEKHPIEHATLVLHHIMTSTCKKHAWWRAHLDAFSAKALAQLTSEILPELGLVPKPELPPDIPMPVMAATRSTSYTPVMAARPR